MGTATRVALIDAGGANLGSVTYALQRLGAEPVIVRNADGLRGAARVILPGVGAAAPAMRRLRGNGFVDALRVLDAPLLGICLGMQLLFDGSQEGDVECLGLLPGWVARMAGDGGIRIPHMGWNTLEPVRASRLLEGVPPGAQTYFVHAYAAPVTADCSAACSHGQRFAALVERGRVAGAQFHPERSAEIGARMLSNFLAGAG